MPTSSTLIEANFLGLDARIRDASQTYVLEDAELPLMVFGPLGLLRPGPRINVAGIRIPLPRPADLIVEKLLTDRTGEKGARDLLVVAGLFATGSTAVFDEVLNVTRTLSDDARYAIRSSLTVLSLIDARPGMPDPESVRALVKQLLDRMETQA